MQNSGDSFVASAQKSTKNAASEADIYLLLATLTRVPTPELFEKLCDGSIKEKLVSLIDSSACFEDNDSCARNQSEKLSHFFSSDSFSLSELRREFTRLFSHPIKPMIGMSESLFAYWAENPDGSLDDAPRQFINPCANDADRIYRQAGFSRSEYLNEPADTLSTELEFMSRLHEARATAIGLGDTGGERFADECIEEFKRVHLSRWAVEFFETVAKESTSAFYRALGHFGTSFMRRQLENG